MAELCECKHPKNYHNEVGCGGVVELRTSAIVNHAACKCKSYRPPAEPDATERARATMILNPVGGERKMSERYEILDAIMANPDPMIRQRLEMAYDAGRVSVLHEKKIFVDDQDFNCAVTFHTAFTNRDNATLAARIEELEQENAKLLDEVTARRFTDECTDKLLDEREAAAAICSQVYECSDNSTENTTIKTNLNRCDPWTDVEGIATKALNGEED